MRSFYPSTTERVPIVVAELGSHNKFDTRQGQVCSAAGGQCQLSGIPKGTFLNASQKWLVVV